MTNFTDMSHYKTYALYTPFLKFKFDFEVTDINKKLLNIYQTPKLNKNATKAKFIIVAPKCSVKPLSNAVTAALKIMFNQIKHDNFRSQYSPGGRTFWPVQNNETVIDAINKINSINKAQFLHLVFLFYIQTFHTTNLNQ